MAGFCPDFARPIPVPLELDTEEVSYIFLSEIFLIIKHELKSVNGWTLEPFKMYNGITTMIQINWL